VPDISAPPQDNAPQDPNAAYTGPSPVPGAISSSTNGPGAAPAEAPDAPAAPHVAMAARKATPASATAAPAEDDAASGSYMVQLGALNSQPAAQQQWDRISGAMPALFGGKQPDIVAATVNGHVYYRLRTGSFDSKADAAKFCGEVSAAGNACTLANF
jgi:cell division protein FtsN